jgi:tRNA modification GTPase
MIALEGVPFELVDTAGIEPPRDDLERMAVERTEKALVEADLVLELVAPGEEALAPGTRPGRRLRIASKADLRSSGATGGDLDVSSTTGKGIGELRGLILASFGIGPPLAEGTSLVFTKRQERLLTEAVAHRLDLREACHLLLRGSAAS